jgi:predicted dithiol-disulfide oxidoreductase (DUF899 family)
MSRAHHKVVSQEEWLEARRALPAQVKGFTWLRDELARRQRSLPWVKERQYVFASPPSPGQRMGWRFR